MRRRRVLAVTTAAVLAVGGGITVTTAAMGGGDEAAAGDRRLPKETAEVTRGDLVDTKTVDGTLGYGEEWPLMASASGIVTGLPREGATVERGRTLYDLNGEPVTLMYGDVPVYRPLSVGTSGADVEQLERNLDRLGYGDDMTVDDDFTSATADAVRDWQDDRGLPVTGTIDGGEVVFAPGAVRVTSRPVGVGGRSAAGQPVLRVTGTERLVRVHLDTADQQLARKGAGVRVELPDGGTVPGKVTEVGTVATAKDADGQATGSPSPDSTITVEITLDDPDRAGRLDQAPVSVRLESERHKDVLSAPVEALRALPQGGYGVQVVTGGSVRLVPVEPGLYAQGRVEISGPGVTAGTRVGVPAR
ncbi:Multidrug efflux pump subunit AcrA (membrane-fusion protein) [Thermomonospora echinospora]|uniref:Multidrug efflux pump subunit AcrA (Membrane-fusion protein) n=1 Tax=Thermomonospora echinospora TaxID=1992 RepID=A0A1H6CJ08_9ACTN|nr:peptidoglycan-binding protein [Thermomonospora echinospora]SEG72981.1 Multidrug efflux pump subunit AcrA (membrane-fusion protein) [Thermomonospora echinospora]